MRREGIGKVSLPVAAVLEELGKLTLEEGQYRESFAYLKECMDILKPHSQQLTKKDIERVSSLFCFLHRKIELQLH